VTEGKKMELLNTRKKSFPIIPIIIALFVLLIGSQFVIARIDKADKNTGIDNSSETTHSEIVTALD
jgi:hypothetical protein